MGETISYPFRVLANGSVAAVSASDESCITQDIAAIVLTHIGERVLAPSFGLPDPTFNTLEPSQLAAAIGAFGPAVSLDGVDVVDRTSSSLQIRVRYDERPR